MNKVFVYKQTTSVITIAILYVFMKRALLVGVLFCLIGVGRAHAASLYFDPSSATLNRGDIIKVAVRLDPDSGKCINAIDGVIKYSSNIQLVDVSRGDSIMSVWVQPPTIDKQKHTVSFAGGIPNGYCGRISGDPRLTNVVLDLMFQSPGFVVGKQTGSSTATVSFDPHTTAYLNDGQGTPAQLTYGSATFSLSKNAGGSLQNDWNTIVTADKTPPEPFAIQLNRTKSAFSNDYFITFNTTDKQSGIDHYEVMEEPLANQKLFLWGSTNAPWVRVRSPYVLKDQSLNSTIYVKAVDKAGNDYIATLVPDKSKRTLSPHMKLVYAVLATLAVIGLAIVGALGYFFVRWRRRRAAAANVELTDELQSGDETIESNEDI